MGCGEGVRLSGLKKWFILIFKGLQTCFKCGFMKILIFQFLHTFAYFMPFLPKDFVQ